jgi:hypothetical protein
MKTPNEIIKRDKITMKLYEIPKGSRIKAETSNDKGKLGDFIIFHHLDGMYSYCTVEGTDEVIHLPANQELTLSDEGYYQELQKVREELLEQVCDVIDEELRNAPLEVQMSKGIIFANVKNLIKNGICQE